MSEKASNRAAFPFAAETVDALREVFGADVRLVYAEQDGRSIGTRDQPGTAVAMTDMVLTKPELPAKTKGRG